MGASKSTSHHHLLGVRPPTGITTMGSSSAWLPIIFLLVILCGEGNSGSQITFIVGAGDMSPPASASALTASSSAETTAGSGSGGGGNSNNNNHGNGHQAMMMVMPATNNGKPAIESLGNVTVLAGQRGELKCRVSNLANNTVLWLRHRDTHLISAGADAYTADPRFRAFQGPDNTWGLRVSSTRPSDGGIYECQISTTPPISAFTYLTVVEPITHIEGLNGRGAELFIKAGSTINLTCVVEDATDNAPKHILWRHNSRVVNFEWARGGMSLVTEKKSKGVTVSRLLIQKAMRTDSGTYMCAPQNAHPAYVKIVVLEQGEKQAAMQSASPTTYRETPLLQIILLTLCNLILPSTVLATLTFTTTTMAKSLVSGKPASSPSSSSTPQPLSPCDTAGKTKKKIGDMIMERKLAQQQITTAIAPVVEVEAGDKINKPFSGKLVQANGSSVDNHGETTTSFSPEVDQFQSSSASSSSPSLLSYS